MTKLASGTLEKWIAARGWLLPAIDHCAGTHNEESVLLGLMAGNYKLWVFERSAVVTEFQNFATGIKVMHWFLVGGDKEEIKAMEGPMIEFAKSNGCNRISNAGREGWKRELAPMGYQFSCTVLYKDI